MALAMNGCVGEREFPKPTQMCENLVKACGKPVLLEQTSDVFRECHTVGVEGQKDEAHEAQCFAFYDECINECEFYAYYLTLDAGADGGSDAATDLDAQASAPDAASERDE